MKLGSHLLAACVAIVGCAGQTPPAASARADSVERAYAQVNGIRLYYEVHGSAAGVPLVLLPGGGSTIETTYGRVLPYFAQHRRVIALDEQNHGRSGHRSIPERFTDSADDVAGLLEHLNVAQADVMGFSNGASVAMQLAIRHPARVRKLVFAASMTKKSGASAQFWEAMRNSRFADMPQPLKDGFLAVNDDPALLHDMYEKDVERMQNFVETSDEQVRSVNAPTLVLSGDRDVGTAEHAVELTRLLQHARLIILPGTHGEFLGELLTGNTRFEYPELSARLIEGFLDEKY